jgi:hypothetical protein
MTRFIYLALATTLLGCADNEDKQSTPDSGVYTDCLLENPDESGPTDPYDVGDIRRIDVPGQFDKAITVYGLTMVAKDDVDDDFLRAVGNTIVEIFPDDVQAPQEQSDILRHLSRYKATIPVFAGGEAGIDETAIESIEGEASVCDLIFQDTEAGQAMEVVEHILHHVTNIGLHATWPDQWGLNQESTLYAAMEEAQNNGVYNTRDYDEIDEIDIKNRILLQEYAYWIVSTHWDIQQDYGPDIEEWTASTPALLNQHNSMAEALINASVDRTMGAPSESSLVGFSNWETP